MKGCDRAGFRMVCCERSGFSKVSAVVKEPDAIWSRPLNHKFVARIQVKKHVPSIADHVDLAELLKKKVERGRI